MQLTDRWVAAATSNGKTQADIFDSQVKGLAIRISAKGRKAWTVFYSRPATGKRARLTIGTYPEISVSKARLMAIEAKAQVFGGDDPGARKKAAHSAMRVRDLIAEYLARHASQLRSGDAIARRLGKNIVPVIGDVKLADLHRRDVTRAIDRILDRGAKTEANRVFADVRAMIRWAVARGDLDFSPVEAMKTPRRPVLHQRKRPFPMPV